jgi:hypothetical protein
MGPSMGTSAEKPRVKVARGYRFQRRYWIKDLSSAALEWRDPGRQPVGWHPGEAMPSCPLFINEVPMIRPMHTWGA